MINKKPNLFIVGAPRSGTTAMYQYLGAHPEIFMSEHKEPHFFATDIRPQNPWMRQFRKKENYLKLFDKVKEEKILGEASVLYLYSKKAAKNIKKFNPNSKIIIMLRSPFEVARSMYYQLYFGGDENAKTFKEALKIENKRKRGIDLPLRTPRMRPFYYYHDLVMFASQVERYLKVFDKNQIMIIMFDDFVKNTSKVYKKALRFLEVSDTTFSPDFVIVNSNTIHRNKTIQLLMSRVAYLLSFLGFDLFLFLRPLYKKIEKINLKDVKRPPVDIKVEKKFKKDIVKDIDKLSMLTNRNLDHWKI